MTTAYLLEKYGPRLTLEELGEELDLAVGSIYNQVADKTFPIPTYVDGKRRFADVRDIVAHLDACRERARAGHQPERG